jgi:hypothetical protein
MGNLVGIRHRHGVAWLLLAAFCSFLLQPQTGTVSHTHAGDEAPHSHPHLSRRPIAQHDHPHERIPHTHAHHAKHRHSYVRHSHNHHHQHSHHHVHQPRKTQPQPVHSSLQVASSSRAHWHYTTTFHLPGLLAAVRWNPSATIHATVIFFQQDCYWTSHSHYLSRAPPFLS